MAYQIDKFDNSLLTVVEDGTIDQTTNLKLVGKNYAGYGEIQNENMIFLLENFAGGNAPTRAIRGQLWFDSTQNKIKFFVANDNAQPGIGYWKSTGGSEVSSTQPSGLSTGDFWWDTINNQLYVLNDGNEYTLVGPQTAGSGVTNMISDEVRDTNGNLRSIIKATVNDNIIFVISPDEFTLNSVTPVDGYDRIRKGITLKWTKLNDNGVTNSAITQDREFQFHGTASNADKLGGVAADQFLLRSSPSFGTETVNFGDNGIVVGDGLDFKIFVEDDKGVIENQGGTNSELLFKVKDSTGATVTPLIINSTSLVPRIDNSYNIGSVASRWKEIHVERVVGLSDQSSTLSVVDGTTNYFSASVAPTPNTIAARDGSGNISANLLQGTATQARFADLAEKYTTDQEYAIGTVMAVGGEAETRSAGVSDYVVGVISEKPAYLMNSDADGQALALKGRVPVRVVGPVKKGQPIYAWNDGVASTIVAKDIIGIALETSNDEGEKLIECVLKL